MHPLYGVSSSDADESGANSSEIPKVPKSGTKFAESTQKWDQIFWKYPKVGPNLMKVPKSGTKSEIPKSGTK
jgi:hypothetical protein